MLLDICFALIGTTAYPHTVIAIYAEYADPIHKSWTGVILLSQPFVVFILLLGVTPCSLLQINHCTPVCYSASGWSVCHVTLCMRMTGLSNPGHLLYQWKHKSAHVSQHTWMQGHSNIRKCDEAQRTQQWYTSA